MGIVRLDEVTQERYTPVEVGPTLTYPPRYPKLILMPTIPRLSGLPGESEVPAASDPMRTRA